MSDLAAPRLEHVADLDIELAEAMEVGETGAGERRVIPIIGGTVKGPLLNGRIQPAGADFQIIRPNGVAELHACYVIEADGGELISVENRGIRHGPPELIARLRRGEEVDPDLIYFRTLPRFETASPRHHFLNRHLFIGIGARYPDRVKLGLWMLG